MPRLLARIVLRLGAIGVVVIPFAVIDVGALKIGFSRLGERGSGS